MGGQAGRRREGHMELEPHLDTYGFHGIEAGSVDEDYTAGKRAGMNGTQKYGDLVIIFIINSLFFF